MNSAELLTRYADLQRYIDWTAEDERRVAAAAPAISPAIPALIDDFYAEIERHPRAAAVITGGAEQVERLKGTLRNWIAELLAGPYDEAYLHRRARVGWRHVEIGLAQVYTNMALARLRGGMISALCLRWRGSHEELCRALVALNKLLDLDLAIITAMYEEEHVRREQAAVRLKLEGLLHQQREFSEGLLANAQADIETAQQRALRAERLAAIGQVSAGLAHEARNALQRIQASAEMLELEVTGQSGALEYVRRIEQAQVHLQQLFDEVRGYAATIQLDRSPCRLAALWREAWELLAAQRKGRDAMLQDADPADAWEASVDRFRLVQVFRNVLENSLAACSDPVRVTVACSPAVLSGRRAVRISLADNGPGISAEQRRRIFEPFYTTKPKGTGLGMAIAQRLVETHGGMIEVGSPPCGAEIVITLPVEAA